MTTGWYTSSITVMIFIIFFLHLLVLGTAIDSDGLEVIGCQEYPSLKYIECNIGISKNVKSSDLQLKVELWQEKHCVDRAVIKSPTNSLPVLRYNKAGAYQIRAVLETSGGTVTANAHKNIDIKELPSWNMKRAGIEALNPDYLPAPWDPVTVKKSNFLDLWSDPDTVAVWGREYIFGSTGFPQQIIAQGKSLLTSPINIRMIIDGETQQLQFKHREIIQLGKGLVRLVMRGGQYPLDANLDAYIEYDGMIKFVLELIPHTSLRIQELSLSVPVKKEFTKFLSYYTDSPEKTKQYYTGVTCSHIRKIDSARDGVLWQDGPCSYIWITNNKAGICWFTESFKGWIFARGKKSFKLSAQPDTVTLQINIINLPVIIAEPRNYTFGLIATPTKSLPKGWRAKNIIDNCNNYNYGKFKRNFKVLWDFSRIGESQYWFLRDPEKLKNDIETCDRENSIRIGYTDLGLGGINTICEYNGKNYLLQDKTVIEYMDEWATKPNISSHLTEDQIKSAEKVKSPQWWADNIYGLGKKGKLIGSSKVWLSLRSGFADYRLHNIKKIVDEYAVDGIYVDSSMAIRDMRQLHDCFYYDNLGNKRLTYMYFAARDFLKRLRYICEKGKKKPERAVIAGCVGHIIIPVHSFIDYGATGEEYNIGYWPALKKRTYDSVYAYAELIEANTPLTSMAATRLQWNASTHGMVPMLLPQFKGANVGKGKRVGKLEGDKLTDGTNVMLAYMLLNDAVIWPLFCDRKMIVGKIWPVRDNFGIGENDVVFYPYWENSFAVKTSDPSLKVSFYKRGNKLLMFVSNLSRQKKNAEIKIISSSLGAGTVFMVENVFNGRKIESSDLIRDNFNEYEYKIYNITLK
jgi:hypothetical protein